MAKQQTTRHFKTDRFQHIELVNQTALELLDEIREQYGSPLLVTDDARVPGETLPIGAVGNSLHYLGQAFDLRTRDKSSEEMWKLVRAVVNVADWVCRGTKSGVEIELVSSPTDHHLHVGFYLGARSFNTLIIRTE